MQVPAGGGSWSSVSDVNRKENFASIDGEELLQRVQRVPVSTWNYKSQDRAIRHLGPMAQDLFAAFNVGESDLLINSIDIDGVNLAGVQALATRTDSLRSQVRALTADKMTLESRTDSLRSQLQFVIAHSATQESRIAQLEARLQRIEAVVASQK